MWEEVKNKTDFIWHGGNSSQGVPQELPWGSVTAAHSNGSTATSHPSHTDPGGARGSGIIPGAIAAAVFISFLLLLYAVLWKCMLTTPRRHHQMLDIFPGDALPGLFCSHLRFLFVCGAFAFSLVYSEGKSHAKLDTSPIRREEEEEEEEEEVQGS